MTTDPLDQITAAVREIGDYLEEFFAGDHDKIDLWLKSPNPMFGNVAPTYLLLVGRWQAVLDYVREAREDNAAATRITREQFDAMDKSLVRASREGSGPMAMNAKDWYLLADGRTILHEWGMGGESFTVVQK
jgi:hypothetical protein